MTYSELQAHAETRRITIQMIADHIGMSRTGMKQSFENQTLPIKKVNDLCVLLGITPNIFFGWKDISTLSQTQNGGIGNTQNMNTYTEALELLRSETAAKNEQIKVKDEQIAKLLDLLNK